MKPRRLRRLKANEVAELQQRPNGVIYRLPVARQSLELKAQYFWHPACSPSRLGSPRGLEVDDCCLQLALFPVTSTRLLRSAGAVRQDIFRGAPADVSAASLGPESRSSSRPVLVRLGCCYVELYHRLRWPCCRPRPCRRPRPVRATALSLSALSVSQRFCPVLPVSSSVLSGAVAVVVHHA